MERILVCTILPSNSVQYVNKSIVNVKVLQNKNLVMILVLKTAQFLKHGQETGTNLLRNSSCH